MNNTVGKYVHNNSIIHSLDPRIKLASNIIFIVAAFLVPQGRPFILTGLIFIPAAISFFLAKLSWRQLFKMLKPVIYIGVFLFLLNIFLVKGVYPVYWHGGPIYISYESISRTLLVMSRIYIMIVVTTILTSTTKPIDLTKAIEDLMYPLKWIKVPIHIIAMIIAIALRFIPTLLDEAQRIMKAQASRGVDFKNGGIKSKIKATITLMIPLFVTAFAKAEDLGNAMEIRGYDPYALRTRYRHHVPKINDYIVLFFMFGILAMTIVFNIEFKIGFFYLPNWWV